MQRRILYRQRPNATFFLDAVSLESTQFFSPLSPDGHTPAGQLTADACYEGALRPLRLPTNHTQQCKRDLTELTLVHSSARKIGANTVSMRHAACGCQGFLLGC